MIHHMVQRQLDSANPTPEYLQAMKEAFEEVQSPHGWKHRICHPMAECSVDKEKLLHDAIIWYTGSVPTFRRFPDSVIVIVEADGYYATIGA